jgi:hypothetical protein
MRTLLALVFAGAFAFQVQAQEVRQGQMLICDTAEQVESVIAEYSKLKDGDKAIEAANQKAGNPNACAAGKIAYVVTGEVKTIKNEHGEGVIVSIIVVSFQPNLKQFSIIVTKVNRGA